MIWMKLIKLSFWRNERNSFPSVVKEKIDEVLNPSKSSYDPSLTEHDIFNSFGITAGQYYSALKLFHQTLIMSYI